MCRDWPCSCGLQPMGKHQQYRSVTVNSVQRESEHLEGPLSQLLLSLGADVNCMGREEESPLHLAARWETCLVACSGVLTFWELIANQFFNIHANPKYLDPSNNFWNTFSPIMGHADVNLGEPAPPPALDATSCWRCYCEVGPGLTRKMRMGKTPPRLQMSTSTLAQGYTSDVCLHEQPQPCSPWAPRSWGWYHKVLRNKDHT